MQDQCIYLDNLHVLIFCYSTTSLKSTESHLVTCGFSYNTRILNLNRSFVTLNGAAETSLVIM